MGRFTLERFAAVFRGAHPAPGQRLSTGWETIGRNHGYTRYNAVMSTLPRILATRSVQSSRFLHVEQVDLEFANGVRRTYERLGGTYFGAAIIVPMIDAETVLLVREYGVGVQRYELGLPKGRLEQGETVCEGANRELKEEVGYGAKQLSVIGKLSLSPAYMTHMTHVVLAQDLFAERLPGDEPEELEVVPWKLNQLHDLLGREDVSEGRSLAALFMAGEYLAGRYQP